MTHSENTAPAAAHTPGPWDYDMDYIVAPDPTGQHPDIYIAEIADSDDEGRVASTEQQDANRRRICAAINACEGITTEALEQGIIAQQRQALEHLLTAVGDLDAAIDGATDQFDDERAELDTAYRHAHATLTRSMIAGGAGTQNRNAGTQNNDLGTPWSLHFDRDGTEDVAIICDAYGDDLVRSRHFWLPEGDDPVPATLAALRLMAAAPKLREALDYLLEQTVDMDLKHGITLSEGEQEARAQALAAVAE